MIDGQWLMVDGGRVRRGFTLIELLVVTVIMGLVIGIIVSCLAGGIRVWDSVYRHRSAEAGVDVSLSLMEKDLMNSFQFYGISFSGGSRDVSFPGLVNPPRPSAFVKASTVAPWAMADRLADKLGAPPRRGSSQEFPSLEGLGVGLQIGTIKYFFDESQKALFRKEWIYPAEEPSAEDSEKILSKLEDMELHYYSLSNATDKVCEWRNSWNSTTNLPDAARIELSVKNNGQLVKISRTILLPLDEI